MFAVDLQASGLSILPDRIQVSLPTSGVSISFLKLQLLYENLVGLSFIKMATELCPVYAPFFGALGCTSAIVFTCFGAAYGTAKAGVGVCSMAVLRPDLIVKSTSISTKALLILATRYS